MLEAYGDLYLREEIRAEALVRNLPGFARFLPVAALFNGQVVNVAGIARDAGVARTTVQGYLDILVDTLLAYRLPAYETRTRVRERRQPKLYWVDPGVVRAVKRQLGEVTEEERGPLPESWVGTTARATLVKFRFAQAGASCCELPRKRSPSTTFSCSPPTPRSSLPKSISTRA